MILLYCIMISGSFVEIDPQHKLCVGVWYAHLHVYVTTRPWSLCMYSRHWYKKVWFIHRCDRTHSCVIWLVYAYAVTRSYVWRALFVTWLIRMCAMTRDLFVCVPWLVTYSYVCHDSWLIRMCAMTRSCVRHDSLTCVPWLIHVDDMTSSALKNWGMSHIWMVTYMNESCHTYECVMPHI